MPTILLETTKLDAAWDDLLRSSVGSTVFSSSRYIKALNRPFAVYLLKKGNETLGGVHLVLDDAGRSAVLEDNTIYSGVFFRQPHANQNAAQISSERFDLLQVVAEELPSAYDSLEFQLHPEIVDIRAFQWYNYHEGPRYRVDVRYTSMLSIDDFTDPEQFTDNLCFANSSSSRRQEIRYARRKGVYTEPQDDVAALTNFYEMTMARQGIEVAQEKLQRMHDLTKQLLQNDQGLLATSYTAQGRPGSMAFFVLDEKRAYYLIGCSDPELRDQHTGTAVLWDSFFYLRSRNIYEVDLEGINSPKRGWFKLSFGGSVTPYFHVAFGENVDG